MKKLIISIILAIIILGLGCAMGYDWRKYDRISGGYTVVFNPELKTGLVYKNKTKNSALVVVYPSWDSAYVYSGLGQDVFTINQFNQIFVKEWLKTDIDTMSQAVIAEIIPYRLR